MVVPVNSFLRIKSIFEKAIWFRDWSSVEIERLMSKSRIRQCEKSDLIYSDNGAEELVLILSGSAWTCLRNEAEVIKFGIAYPSNLIGLTRVVNEFFHDEPCFEACAAEESETLVIPASEFLWQLESRPILWRSTAKAAVVYQRHCLKLALVLCAGATKDRLISAIYQFGLSAALHYHRRPQFELTIPQDELAILIQSSRQHVSRALKELELEGLISLGYRRVEITDPAEIERRALARFSKCSQSGIYSGSIGGLEVSRIKSVDSAS